MNISIRPLGMTLGPLKEVFLHLMTSRLKNANVPYSFDQMIVLLIVDHCPKAQQEIATIMQRDKSVILRMIDLLENDGLLSRIPDQKDRRRNNIILTKKGTEYVHRYKNMEKEMTEVLLQGLNPEEINTFYKVIDHITQKGQSLQEHN